MFFKKTKLLLRKFHFFSTKIWKCPNNINNKTILNKLILTVKKNKHLKSYAKQIK